MPTVEFQGTLHEFPDTFTDAQIGRALKGVSLRGQQDAARNELLPRLAGLMPAPDAYEEPARPKFQPSSFADLAGENAMRPEGKLPRAPRITAQDAARAFDVLGAAAEFARQGAFNPNASTELDERMARDVTPGMGSKIAAGVQQTAAGLADPEAIALMAATAGMGVLPKVLQRIGSGTFAAWMAHNAGQQAADLEQAIKDDDVEGAARATAGLGMDTLFAGLSAKHALSGIAKDSPRIAGWLSKKVAVESIPPAELKAAYHRLERGMGTEADANLVRMVNEGFDRPREAYRQGVTVEETSPRVGPAFRDWLGVPEVTGGRTVRLRDGREVVVNEETGGAEFPAQTPGPRPQTPRLLSPPETLPPEATPPSTAAPAPAGLPTTKSEPISSPLVVRPEAAMETRPSARWTPDAPREPAVDPDLAETIAALRAGYRPEVEKLPEPVAAPFPPYAEKLGIKSWQQAKKLGLDTIITDAPDMAREVVRAASNWIYASPERAAEHLAGEIVTKTRLLGGRDTALRSLANDYYQKAKGATEPGQQQRFNATAQALEALRAKAAGDKAAPAEKVKPAADTFLEAEVGAIGAKVVQVKAEKAAKPVEQMTPEESEALRTTLLKGVENRGDGIFFVPEKLMTPARRKAVQRGGDAVQVKPWSDVTGVPSDRGYAILDRRERIAARTKPSTPAPLTPTEVSEFNALEQARRTGALDATGAARYRELEVRAGQGDFLAPQPKPAEVAPPKELAQVSDDVTWKTGAGDMARSTVQRISKLPNDAEPMADVDWFGVKRVPVSQLQIVKKSSRRVAEEQRAAKDNEAKSAAAQADAGTRGFYKEPSGKTVIVMPKAEYDALPEATRSKIVRYFNWSPRRKAFISKASKDDYWARQISREVKLEEMEAREVPEPVAEAPAVAAAKESTARAEEAKKWTPPETDQRGLEKDKADVAAAKVQIEKLQEEWRGIKAEHTIYEGRVINTRGKSYERGRIKASAKKSDIVAYENLSKSLREWDNAIDFAQKRVGDAAKRVRAAELNAIAADAAEPPVRQIGAAVGALYEAGRDVPEEAVRALEQASREEIRQRIPDVQESELQQMQSYLASDMMNGRTSVAESFKNNPGLDVQKLRRAELLAALKEITNGVLTGDMPEEMRQTLAERVPGWEQLRYGGTAPAGQFPLRAGDVAKLAEEMRQGVALKRAANEVAAAEAKAKSEATAAAENAEAATVRQMMADAADEMAKSGNKRSATQIKDELVARLEAAVKDAPVQVGADGAKRRVLIGVPGDGVFALVNTKAVLQEILKRAKAMSTATGVADTGKARGTPVPAVNKKALTPAEIVKQMGEFESGDDARRIIQQVYADGSRALVTDAGTLVEVKGPFPAKNNPDALFPVATADQSFATAAGGASQPAKVSTEDLFRIGRLRMGLEWGDTVAYVDLFEGKDGQIYAEAKDKEQNIAGYGRPTTDRYLGRYNAESLEKLARFARKMGDESVTLTPSEWMVKAKPSAGKDGKGVEPPKDIKMAAGILQGGKWRAVTMRFGNEATVPPPEATKVRETGRSSPSASASPMPAGRPVVGSPPPLAGPPPLPHEEPAFSALPLGMPELVDLYKSLSAGQYPKVVQAIARLPWAAGVFRHNDSTGVARVELLAKLFKLLTPEEEAALLAQAREYAQTVAQPGDNIEELVRERYRNLLKTALEEAKRRGPVRAQQVLAHEIMHWIDWVRDHTLKRGNILGHIAAFKDSWLKHWLARDPAHPHGKPLTSYEKEKLRAEARKQMQAELGPMREIVRTILVEEPVWEIAGVKPEDVKNLFGMNAREELPELYLWFTTQPDAVKVEIVKAAMKGIVDERLAALGTKKQVGTKTIEKTVRERVGREPTPEEVAGKFQTLLRAEIRKRNLVELDTIKRELEATIAWYQGTPTMDPYFKTGIEMFAEAGSIWLNNPFALAQRAPTFHAALVNWLGHRPEVKRLYDQIQEDLRTGAHQDKRRTRLREMFKRGDEKGMERRHNSMDKPQFLDGVRYELDRVFGPVYRRAKGSALEGSVYQAVGDFRYRAAEQELFLSRENNEVGRLLAENALDWQDFGELLTYRRIVEERFDLANPLGITPKDALEGIERLKATLGPVRYGKLVEAAEKFNGLWQEMVVKPLVETGYVSPELADKMQGNTVYATFSVQRAQSEEGINRLLDMAFGAGIGPKIYRQMGTLQEIKNPATAAVLKGLSLISAVHRNTAKREVVKLMQEVDPELIREADQNWNGKRHEWVMKDTPHVGTVVVMNGGQPTAYYVPRTISDALNGADPMESQLAIAAIKANNALKALYTQLNYGFWPVNLMRDTGSFWLQMPGAMSPLRWAKNLPRSWRAAVSSEKGTPNADAKEALRRLMVISRAEYRGLEAADEHELTLESFGQTPADWDRTAKQQHLLMRAWLKYKGLVQTLERLNKINGMLYLDEYFPNKPEWQKQKIVRELAGSPDFLERSGSAAVNWAMMFYNPWKEGLHSLKAAAKADPWGFSFKTFALVMLPAVLQALAASGILGDERKKLYRSIPDYDLSNYWCVPLGWQNEKQGKAAYLRLPLPEPMRIMNGVIFHSLTQRGQGLMEYGAGQLPGLNSFAKVAMGWAALTAGQNPHDTFRGKDVVDKDTFEAGGLPVAAAMGKWTWNELGGGIIHRFRDPQLTDAPQENVEKFLQMPVVSNLLGRWVKVSSRGIDDQDRKLAEPVRQQRAQARVAVREMVRKFETKEPWGTEEHALINKDAYAAQYLAETLAKVLPQRDSLELRRWERRESNAERGAVFAPKQ